MPLSFQIQLRRGTSIQWLATNPILAEGEPAVETDTHKLKVGNGVDHWSALPYFPAGSGGSFNLTALSPLIFDSNTNTLSLDEPSVVLDGNNF